MGRPQGSLNKEASLRYVPKRWTPKHDMVVSLHIIGKYNKDIAEIVGFHEIHIGNILDSPQAKAIIDNARVKIHNNTSDRIKDIQEMAMSHIHNFVKDEHNLQAKSPFNFIAQTVNIAKGVGTLKDSSGVAGINNSNNTVNNVIITVEAADRLGKALELSKLIEVTPSTLMNNGTI